MKGLGSSPQSVGPEITCQARAQQWAYVLVQIPICKTCVAELRPADATSEFMSLRERKRRKKNEKENTIERRKRGGEEMWGGALRAELECHC